MRSRWTVNATQNPLVEIAARPRSSSIVIIIFHGIGDPHRSTGASAPPGSRVNALTPRWRVNLSCSRSPSAALAVIAPGRDADLGGADPRARHDPDAARQLLLRAGELHDARRRQRRAARPVAADRADDRACRASSPSAGRASVLVNDHERIRQARPHRRRREDAARDAHGTTAARPEPLSARAGPAPAAAPGADHDVLARRARSRAVWLPARARSTSTRPSSLVAGGGGARDDVAHVHEAVGLLGQAAPRRSSPARARRSGGRVPLRRSRPSKKAQAIRHSSARRAEDVARGVGVERLGDPHRQQVDGDGLADEAGEGDREIVPRASG